jgi:hypothetical protein
MPDVPGEQAGNTRFFPLNKGNAGDGGLLHDQVFSWYGCKPNQHMGFLTNPKKIFFNGTGFFTIFRDVTVSLQE